MQSTVYRKTPKQQHPLDCVMARLGGSGKHAESRKRLCDRISIQYQGHEAKRRPALMYYEVSLLVPVSPKLHVEQNPH
jgi:hypothetical protein